MLYRLTNYYSPAHERGLMWDDAVLSIGWPEAAAKAILSERGCRNPRLSDLTDLF